MKDNTIYIVAGYMRSGTSMMMKAFEAGGLEAVKSAERDKMNEKFGDEHYKVNAGGFYEDPREWQRPDFPIGHEGKLVKILYDKIATIPVAKYKVAYMTRDAEEIRQSFEAAFQGQKAPHIERYEKMTARIIAILKNRRDMEVEVFEYRKVIENPREQLERLESWGIDIEKAVATIDPKQYRFRKEDLTIGI